MEYKRPGFYINPFAILLLISITIEAYLFLKLAGKLPARDGIFDVGTASTSGIMIGIYVFLLLFFIRIFYILSRNYAVIQQMKAGKYWLRWDYSDEDRKRYAKYLPKGTTEVYIGPKGVFYSSRRFFLNGYHDGLFDVGMSVSPIDALHFMNMRSFIEPQTYSTVGRPVRERTRRQVTSTLQCIVPIPEGRQAEARQLSEEWTNRPLSYGFALSNTFTSGLLLLMTPIIMWLTAASQF